MVSEKTDNRVIDEIRQRVIRLETRLMCLGTKLGFDLKDDEYIEVMTGDPPHVILQTLDVPYTSVIKACRRAGLHRKKVAVYFNDELIAEMPV
jgi:hypothetical protein